MPFETDKLEKAQLIAYSPDDSSLSIQFMFNPTEISFARTIEWKSDPGNRGETLLPKVNFSGVSPYKFTLNGLLFDEFETKKNVLEWYVDKLKRGVEAPKNKPGWRPPVYNFQWGDKPIPFYCVVTSFTYKLTMFLANGTPVRALVDLALQEVDPKGVGVDKSLSKGKHRTAYPSSKLGPAEPDGAKTKRKP